LLADCADKTVEMPLLVEGVDHLIGDLVVTGGALLCYAFLAIGLIISLKEVGTV